jgi:hypothetical protein
LAVTATALAAASRIASAAASWPRPCLVTPTSDGKCPTIAAPTRKAPRATREADTEKPFAPAMAKPRKTTLPVMLPTNTRPSRRTETASTAPVTTVITNSSLTRMASSGGFASGSGCTLEI